MMDLHGVNVVVDEAAAFLDRHPDITDHPLAATAGLAFGFLRALAECPRCPGHFRVPTSDPPDGWHCPRCGGTWVPVPAAPTPPTTRTRQR